MKKIIYLVFIGVSFISCGGGGGETPPPPPVNRAPSTPLLSAPADELLCVDNTVSFQWSASSDPDNDAVTYTIEIATNNGFTDIVQTLSISGTSTTATLEDDKAYYWRVQAFDTKSAKSSYSSVYKFYTYGIGVTNRLPFAPVLKAPNNNATVQPDSSNEVTLEWEAVTDLDAGDVLTYEIHMGTTNPINDTNPTSTTATSIKEQVAASTTYFWQVIVKDDKGGETIGQVWKFITD